VEKMLSGPKGRKKGGEMLVMSKTPWPVDHDGLRHTLLEMDYQPNK